MPGGTETHGESAFRRSVYGSAFAANICDQQGGQGMPAQSGERGK